MSREWPWLTLCQELAYSLGREARFFVDAGGTLASDPPPSFLAATREGCAEWWTAGWDGDVRWINPPSDVPTSPR